MSKYCKFIHFYETYLKLLSKTINFIHLKYKNDFIVIHKVTIIFKNLIIYILKI